MRDSTATSARTLYKTKSGQFIYNRMFTFEGSCALVSDECDGSYISNELPPFEIKSGLASVKLLMTLFMTESDWHMLRTSTKGGGDRRFLIQPEHIRRRPVWTPPPEEVICVNALFDSRLVLKTKYTAIRKANAALLPATLDRLFGDGPCGSRQ